MDVNRAVDVLLQARFARRQIDSLPDDCRPQSLAEGYVIQAALAARAGDHAGWKIATVGSEGQARLGVNHPLIGRLPREMAKLPGARMSCAELPMPLVEPEFAFVIGSRLDSGGTMPTDEEVLDTVDTVVLAIEMPESRFRNPETRDAATLVADNSMAGPYILGAAVPLWRELDLNSVAIALIRNGVIAATGSGAANKVGPVQAFIWLVRLLREWHEPLQPGQAVITGTLTPALPVTAGDEVIADFGELGRVMVFFDP